MEAFRLYSRHFRTRTRYVALRALADGGPDAVRVEPLARALGVTKGGFYWAFDGRQALLDRDWWTVLGAIERGVSRRANFS